jgi:DNA polymerase-1
MAKTYIDHYFSRYRGVKAFMEGTIEEARAARTTSTLMGRIRMLPDIASSNRNVRMFAERTAINTPIQGSAADLLKMAMIRTDAALRKRGFQAAMILTVHDELVFEVPPRELEAVRRLVTEMMEGVWQLKVPLRLNVAWGKDWTEAH